MERSCECGICGHFSERECFKKECACCINFHMRSGPRKEKMRQAKGDPRP